MSRFHNSHETLYLVLHGPYGTSSGSERSLLLAAWAFGKAG